MVGSGRWGQQGTPLMKSQRMEMDEEWAERGRAGEGREAAAASRAGMNGEVERWKGGGAGCGRSEERGGQG